MPVNPTRWQINEEVAPNIFAPATSILPHASLDGSAVFADQQDGPATVEEIDAIFATYDWGPLQGLLSDLHAEFGRSFSCGYLFPA